LRLEVFNTLTMRLALLLKRSRRIHAQLKKSFGRAYAEWLIAPPAPGAMVFRAIEHAWAVAVRRNIWRPKSAVNGISPALVHRQSA
jgi:hypothetical protein